MSLTRLINLPPKWLVNILHCISIIRGCFNFFFASSLGLLVFSLFLYGYVSLFCETKPLNPQKFVISISSLEKEYIIAIISSLLTITGFLIAFHSASANWIKQRRIELSLKAADEIRTRYNEACKLVVDMRIFAKSALDVKSRIINMQPQEIDIFQINMIIDKVPLFINSRSQFSRFSIDIHDIKGRYITLFHYYWGLDRIISELDKNVDAVSSRMWFTIPIINPTSPDLRNQFIRLVDEEKYSEFISVCDNVHTQISTRSGMAAGMLESPIHRVTFWSMINQFRFHPYLTAALESLKKKE